MDKQVVIVTGASRGLGAAIAQVLAGSRYAEDGRTPSAPTRPVEGEGSERGLSRSPLSGDRNETQIAVTLAARSLDELEEQARRIRQAGGQALVVQADVSREADCRRIVNETLEAFGRIDALVNNGGIIEPIGPIADAQVDEWERNWAINVLGPVLLAKLALPSLRQTGGRVINITSGSAELPIGGWGAYSSAKIAINHLTRILASEEPSITALAVRPGLVDTGMQAAIRREGPGRMAEANYRQISGLYEAGKLLPPEKPARAIAWLSLYAPHEWSGEILQWDDARVQELVKS